MTNTPRVLSLIGDENGCTLWRTWGPFTELQKQGVFAHWKHKDDPELISPAFVAKVPANFDAVILPRLSWQDHEAGQRYIRSLHAVGMAVILEVDDDVFSSAIVGRQKATTEPLKLLEQLEQDRLDRIIVLQQCDGVTVSTPRLATVVRTLTDRPVRVVPNAIDAPWWRDVLRGVRRVVPPLTVGWAGGARYPEDLTAVAEAWHNLARRYPEVTFVVQGHMAEVLIDAVPEDRCRRLPWLPVAEYPRAMVNIDIGCASVADKHFNRAKTPIKLWEYTLAGAAVVASPTLYGPAIEDGWDGLIASTAKEWETQLARLVESPDMRRFLRRAQRKRIMERHTLAKNAWRWPDAWASILADFHARQAGTLTEVAA